MASSHAARGDPDVVQQLKTMSDDETKRQKLGSRPAKRGQRTPPVQATWHVRPFQRTRRTLQAWRQLDRADIRRAFFAFKQDCLQLWRWHYAATLFSRSRIWTLIIPPLYRKQKAMVLLTFSSRRTFYAFASETYDLYLRALATGDTQLMARRATERFLEEVARQAKQLEPGYIVEGPTIHPENSVKPRLLQVTAGEHGMQALVRFRTTQSLYVYDHRGELQPHLSSDRVPVIQYIIFERPFNSDINAYEGDWRMAMETFEAPSILDVTPGQNDGRNPHEPSPNALVYSHDTPWTLSPWERLVKWWDARRGPPTIVQNPDEMQLAARGI